MRLLSLPSLLLLLSPLTSSLPMADDASLDSQLANPDSYPGLDTRKKPKQVTFPGGKCYSDRKNIVAASYVCTNPPSHLLGLRPRLTQYFLFPPTVQQHRRTRL